MTPQIDLDSVLDMAPRILAGDAPRAVTIA